MKLPSENLVNTFLKWHGEWSKTRDPSVENYYNDAIKNLGRQSREDFIEFFVGFYRDGGKIQSGGSRNAGSFKESIENEYDAFHTFALEPFSEKFDENIWLDQVRDYPYFGEGLATIYLNRVDKKRFAIVNNKSRKSMELIGIKVPRAPLSRSHAAIRDAERELINHIKPFDKNFDNFFRIDSLNEFLIGDHPKNEEWRETMAPHYFNRGQFELLRDCQGKDYDSTDAEQERVYRELQQAYDVTKDWAEALRKKLFPNGKSKTVRKPTDRLNRFLRYNCGRIYPSMDAPKALAYTVGIDSEFHIFVKIDLIYTEVEDKIQHRYEKIRGDSDVSPIVAIMSADEGLKLDFSKLVDWSVEAIKNFKISYDDLAAQLGLSAVQSEVSLSNGDLPDDDIEDEPKSHKPPRNFIYYGPPGTGKTFKLQGLLKTEYTDVEFGKRYEFVTFHQSYGYEEFVEGLRPVITKCFEKGAEDSEPPAISNGEVHYEIKPGSFLRLCDRARANPSRQYAMVIDEINRGNISKIFGELITLMEVDKREGATYAVTLTLPYSGKSFSVPSNVDVIGTMNTADRSLALLDTALRRRFEFIELMPDPSVLADTVVSLNGVKIDIQQMLTMLNKRIEALYDRDHTLGHAYFTRIKDSNLLGEDLFNELKAVFKNKIIPLLEEYFLEDWQKIRLVLGDNQKPKEYQFVHAIGREEDLLALFGRDHELDQYALRPRYQLNAGALDQPDSYVGIYTAKATVIDAAG